MTRPASGLPTRSHSDRNDGSPCVSVASSWMSDSLNSNSASAAQDIGLVLVLLPDDDKHGHENTIPDDLPSDRQHLSTVRVKDEVASLGGDMEDGPPIGELSFYNAGYKANATSSSYSCSSFMSLAETEQLDDVMPVLVEDEEDLESQSQAQERYATGMEAPTSATSRLSTRRVQSADAATLKQRMCMSLPLDTGSTSRRRRHSPRRSKTADARIITTLYAVRKTIIRVPKRRLSRPSSSITNPKRSLGRTFTIDSRMAANPTGSSALDRMSRRMRVKSLLPTV